MKRCRAAVVAAVLFLGCLLPVVARAANIPYSLSVTPFAGGYVFEGNQHITDRAVYGASIGYNLDEHWGLEATYSAVPDAWTTNTNQTGGAPGVEKKLTVHEVRGDVLYHFFPDCRLVPYVAAGAGWIFIEPEKGATDDDVLVDYGVGLKYFLAERVALRADIRHIFDITYHDTVRPRDFYNNFAYTAGVTFQLGGVKPAARAVEEAKPAPAVKPLPQVPPAKAEPVPPPPAPATAQPAEPVKPEEAPAPPPAEEKPLLTEIVPTGEGEKVTVRIDIEFASGSAEIPPNTTQVQRLADFMIYYPHTHVHLEGHSDSTGNARENLSLSRKRVESLKNYLVKVFGIKASRITATGYGASRPIADNRTAEGRRKNRRVMAVITATRK
jgi:OOP family OmpA-OmpF porin